MRLSGRRYAVLVADGVEDLEYWVTVMRLQEEGAEVVSVGSDTKPHRGKNGVPVQADTLGTDKMRRDPHLVRLVRDANEKGLPMGIICHGGSVAITAGIVRGKRVTGSLGIKDDLVNAGGIWVDEPAFRDANQVWGRVVADIPAFTRELVALCVRAAGA
jgi:protease I